ncbi:hypothetical protein C0992_005489, partial [Termitomyces sp. T32_za158]
MDDIRLLQSLLRDGECQWMFLTSNERKEHEQKLVDARSRGMTIGRKRKERSDKGKEWKGQEKQASRKKKKTTSQLPLTYKSAEFVHDDDQDSERGSDDSGDD